MGSPAEILQARNSSAETWIRRAVLADLLELEDDDEGRGVRV